MISVTMVSQKPADAKPPFTWAHGAWTGAESAAGAARKPMFTCAAGGAFVGRQFTVTDD